MIKLLPLQEDRQLALAAGVAHGLAERLVGTYHDHGERRALHDVHARRRGQ